MLGAIIGDIVGSKYEFNNIKTKEFPLFSEGCCYTDDTIMTVAVASALMKSYKEKSDFKTNVIKEMQAFGQKYPHPMGGYGARFSGWLRLENPEPYNSLGNGSAMRVSPCGMFAVTLEEVLLLAKESAEVTHNHPEGIKGAQATAAAIFLAKKGYSKEEIRAYICENFYELDKSLDEIREIYEYNETCMDTVPQAIVAFLESEYFEDAIRNAVSLGGDCDTLTAITGSIAWAYYHGSLAFDELLIIAKKALEFLPDEFIDIISEFDEVCMNKFSEQVPF